MKKTLLIILIGFISFNSYGQIRHAKGLKAIDLSVGLTDVGPGFQAGYLMYLNSLSAFASVSYDSGKKASLNDRKAQGFTFDIGVGYTPISINNSLFMTIYGGPSVSYDQVTDAEAYSTNSSINYGVMIKPEVEYFFSDAISIMLQIPTRYLIQSEFGGLRLQAYLGVRYNF